MTTTYLQKWNLDNLFSRDTKSISQATNKTIEFSIDSLSKDILILEERLNQTKEIASLVLSLQEIEMQCNEIESYIGCLLAQDVTDLKAVQWNDHLSSLKSSIENCSNKLNALLLNLSDVELNLLLKDKSIQPIGFLVQERCQWAKQKLPIAQEQLVNELSIDGYQGWERLYEATMGQQLISYQDGKTTKELSVGQAENKLTNPDRLIRSTMFKKLENTWQSQENSFAQILNHLGGFRIKVYQARGWNSVLHEPLYFNRMQKSTLDTMWDTVKNNKTPIQSYLNKKAKLLGLTKLSWYDVEAPLPTNSQQTISYNDAADLIITQFHVISPDMGKFAEHAFKHKWIEAEDRAGKMPGGFCSHHPKSKESRIFMTYSGTTNNLFTLAHELGHAYHGHAIRNLPYMAQQYRMNVAETASTLAEMIISDSILKGTKDPIMRQSLLDNKLQRAVIFLMNIHSRFIFENRFYEARKKGFVTSVELNQMMTDAQKEGFCDALGEWHPHFWVSKKHFYITDVPFYNFPYTFGYLFSMGIYAMSKELGNEFEKHYNALLCDTGRMTVEDLAQKHLGVDLKQPLFWQNALNSVKNDVDLF
ncbi:MAG: M3 family oligoendopeptidase [Parachlamydiaceae bacterium]|nr:M3 family oligoendopeptidase [Parachlamydiaceae bacterium]